METIRSHFSSAKLPRIVTKVMDDLGQTDMSGVGKKIAIRRDLYQAARTDNADDRRALAFLIAVTIVHELGHWKFQMYRCAGSTKAAYPQKPFKKESGEYLEIQVFGGIRFTSRY